MSGRARTLPVARRGDAGSCPPLIVEGLYSFARGGSETLGALLARHFAKRGYRTCGVSFFDADGPIRQELEADGIECRGLDLLGRSRYSRLFFRRDVMQLLRELAPDVVHLHHGVTAIRAVPEARRAGVRHVCMTEHSTLQLDSEPGYRVKTRRVMPLIDSVTVLNEDMREFFVRSLPESRSRLSLVPNAVNPRFLLLRRDPATDGRVTVGFLGRLEPVKDVATLLRAIAIVHRRGAAHVDLWLAGDGSQRQELESLAASLGIARDVRFLGAVPDAATLYAASDVFALPSVSEGTPLVLMEAMSAALPCVATTVGGVPELIEGVGVLVPPSDADAMAGGLLRLVEDESLRRTLGRQARARIEAEYSIDAMLDRYLAVFGLPPYWDT